jgi:hypothetical protein
MCHAIIKVKYRVKETAQVQAETETDLNDRIIALEGNDEVLEYRVYVATGKRVRVTAWEDRA